MTYQESIIVVPVVLENWLKASARNQPLPSEPLYLRILYNEALYFIDSEGQPYKVEEDFLMTFSHIYTNQAYNTVRLSDWSIELQFEGRRCTHIWLISTTVTFLGYEINKEITGALFKLTIISRKSPERLLPINGYLNRLRKRQLVAKSYQIDKTRATLTSFIPFNPMLLPSYVCIPYSCPTLVKPGLLQSLSPRGQQLLRKLTHFISREDICQYMSVCELSRQSRQKLRQMIFLQE